MKIVVFKLWTLQEREVREGSQIEREQETGDFQQGVGVREFEYL